MLTPALLLVVSGCDTTVTESLPVSGPCGALSPTGTAAWDPILTDPSCPAQAELTADTPLEPLRYAGATYAWRAEGAGFLPGVHTIEATEGVTGAEVTIAPWGRDPAFDPASIVGATYSWVVDDAYAIPDAAAVAATAGIRLQILSVEGDAALFRVIADNGGDDCEVLRDHATLSATGELSWSRHTLVAALDPYPVFIAGPWLHLGFSADGAEAAGVEGGATVDLRPLNLMLFGEDDPSSCGPLGNFGGACWDCIDEGATCTDVLVHASRLVSTASPADSLPVCGVQLEEVDIDVPVISCEPVDVSCASAGRRLGPGALVLVGLSLLRRRGRPGRAGQGRVGSSGRAG